LEYREDLEYFYEDGYGHSINYVQACPIVKDVVDHFTQVVESAPYQPKGLFYFTHSGTLLKGKFYPNLCPVSPINVAYVCYSIGTSRVI
jgi:hypothetical protein